MSRSYKKHAIVLDRKGKSKKRLANSRVRSWLKNNPDVLLKGKNFRKIYEPWDVCEYVSRCSWEEYGKDWGEPFPNKKKEYRYWYTTFKRK